MSTSLAHPSPQHPSMGLGAAALASMLWGFGGILGALTFAPGVLVAFYRLWIGTALLLALTYGSGRRVSVATIRAATLGGIFLSIDMITFFTAVKFTSIVDVSLIGAFQPALIILAARKIFGERMRGRDVGLIVVAMVGVTLTVVGAPTMSRHAVLGNLLALGSLVSFSAYWLVSKRARERHDALEYTTGVTLVAAMSATPVVLVLGQSLAQVHARDWLWIVLLAIVPGGGHLLMNWAHRFVDASISSAISCLSPLVAAVAAIPILGQPLSTLQVTGVVVGLSAIAVVAARHRQPAAPPVE